MDESDDYESEILFYSLNEQKRERNRLLRRFLLLLAGVAGLFVLLVLFDQLRAQPASLRSPSPASRRPARPGQPGAQTCQLPAYDYLQLVVRWPPSVCLFNSCEQQQKGRWVIYGLWPTFYNGSSASSCCTRNDFDPTLLDDLQPALAVSVRGLLDKWPNLIKGQNWSQALGQQWFKYGSCLGTGDLPGETLVHDSALIQRHFVDTVRQLAGALPDVRDRLEQRQIRPQTDTNRTYTYAAIGGALRLNRSAVVQCSKYRTKHGRLFSLLDTLLLCFDRYSLQAIDCPNVVEDCQEEIFYPDLNTRFH